MKRSKTLWFLSLLFAWTALKSTGYLYDVTSVTDYGLLNSIGLGFLFYVITVPIMIGEGLTAFLLFTRRAQAYVVGCITIIAQCVNAMFISAIVTLNPDTAKSFYVASRATRGMSKRAQSEIDFNFSPMGIAVILVVCLVWLALVFYFLRRTKPELV
jgi:hypothetical protein